MDPSDTTSPAGSVHAMVTLSASSGPATSRQKPSVSPGARSVRAEDSSQTTAAVGTSAALASTPCSGAKTTELARLSRPQPCRGDGGGSSGSPTSSNPSIATAPLMATARRSAADGSNASAAFRDPVG